MQAAQPSDPYRAMLRGGLLPAVAVGAAAVVVSGVLDGRRGLAGGALALAVVLATMSSGLLVISATARRAPALVVVVGMAAYVGKVGLLALFLVAFLGADWLSGRAFALTGMAAAAAWLPGELWAFTRTRTLLYDHDPGPVG